jgi:hypothetical protein
MAKAKAKAATGRKVPKRAVSARRATPSRPAASATPRTQQHR